MSSNFIETIGKITSAETVLQFNANWSRKFKGILGQIETLEIKHAARIRGDGEFYELVLQYCTNLRHLIIRGIDDDAIIIGVDNTWLQHIYPNLESIHIDNIDVEAGETYGDGKNVKKLAQFLQVNPNVHTFSTSYDWFEANIKKLLEGRAAFDELRLQSSVEPCQIDAYISKRLKKLYDNGAYQRLRLYKVELTSQQDLNLIATIPAIEILFIEEVKCVEIRLPAVMTTLQAIGFRHASELQNPKLLYIYL